MALLPVKDFFSNKVNIQLKSGQRFEGLLSSIDYQTSTVILQDVEDLGNEHDPNTLPHDKKIAEKAFECDNINEIFLREKHFSEPKKYKKAEFWDAMSEPQPQPKKYRSKKEDGEHRGGGGRKHYDKEGRGRGYRGDRGDRGGRREEDDHRGGGYRGNRREDNESRGGYRQRREEEEKGGYRGRKEEQVSDRDLR